MPQPPVVLITALLATPIAAPRTTVTQPTGTPTTPPFVLPTTYPSIPVYTAPVPVQTPTPTPTVPQTPAAFVPQQPAQQQHNPPQQPPQQSPQQSPQLPPQQSPQQSPQYPLQQNGSTERSRGVVIPKEEIIETSDEDETRADIGGSRQVDSSGNQDEPTNQTKSSERQNKVFAKAPIGPCLTPQILKMTTTTESKINPI